MLLFLTLFATVVSFAAHILLFFGIIPPPKEVSLALNIGLFVLVALRLFTTKDLREGNDWFRDNSIKGICPLRIKVSTMIIMGYGLGFGLVSLIHFTMILVPALNGTVPMDEAGGLVASKSLFNSVFLFFMAFYSLESMLNYSFRTLKKTKEKTVLSELYDPRDKSL